MDCLSATVRIHILSSDMQILNKLQTMMLGSYPVLREASWFCGVMHMHKDVVTGTVVLAPKLYGATIHPWRNVWVCSPLRLNPWLLASISLHWLWVLRTPIILIQYKYRSLTILQIRRYGWCRVLYLFLISGYMSYMCLGSDTTLVCLNTTTIGMFCGISRASIGE